MKKSNNDYLNLARKIGHLNDDTMDKIKALNLDGRTVLGYVQSSKNEKWKKPAAEWIDELYKRKVKKK